MLIGEFMGRCCLVVGGWVLVHRGVGVGGVWMGWGGVGVMWGGGGGGGGVGWGGGGGWLGGWGMVGGGLVVRVA